MNIFLTKVAACPLRTRLTLAACFAALAFSQRAPDTAERYREMSAKYEREGLAAPFKGITANGTVENGLFPIRSTGVSTEPVRKAAETFLAALTAEQRAKTMFAVDDPEWRKWMNQHFYVRQDLYISNMDDGHARVKMDEVKQHLDNTWFAWTGGSGADSVFYYRIHSPVILIEFDHQRPANLAKFATDPNMPTRQHIHVAVRTSNGNDYGKDLLREHYAQSPHSS